jgi:predicted ATP-grasp superfamily ATP-dependent carboligase
VTDSRKPAAVLFDGSYYGTLAAVRSLGADGVPVIVADCRRRATAFFSRHTARRLRCPPTDDGERLIEWLATLPRRDGTGPYVVYPTSDEIVVLLASHRAALSDEFVLYQPDLRTTWRVLDKKNLLEEARAAGLEVPDTWFPRDESDVRRAAREAGGPLMIKPRTQVMLSHHCKGALVTDDADGSLLVREYDRFRRENSYAPWMARTFPELTQPLLQRYHGDASQRVYSIAGFRDATGRHLAMSGSVKVLQRPRGMGIGLCFESAAIARDLARLSANLLERLGYFGVFELEFLRHGERSLLIDMNPRFYNQIALDIARGLDLPRIAYAAALGDEAAVARLVAAHHGGDGPVVFCNRIGLNMLLGAKRIFGQISREDASNWRRWASDPSKTVIDSVDVAGDRVPILAEAACQVYDCLRHPRGFLKNVVFDR